MFPRFICLLTLLSVILTPLALNCYVRVFTSDRRYTQPADVPSQPVAIVFGAGVWEDGTPTPMLADRVRAAVDLYKMSRISKILMTGDNSSRHYNEVKAMQEY
ncbi:MAG: hypothetical protein F6K35_29470, partial [Okeania sp. SIO2H7]|nr:hypothetical protein [Okeania sp. SIO2H7]